MIFSRTLSFGLLLAWFSFRMFKKFAALEKPGSLGISLSLRGVLCPPVFFLQKSHPERAGIVRHEGHG